MCCGVCTVRCEPYSHAVHPQFKVDLPLKRPMMHFQLWDRDLLRLELIPTRVVGIVSPSYSRVGTSYNDCIAESVLDLSAAFRIACVSRQSSGALLALPCLPPVACCHPDMPPRRVTCCTDLTARLWRPALRS